VGGGAHLTGLCRTRSGPFRIDDAHALADVASARLVALPEALGHMPALRASADTARDIAHGKRVPVAALEPGDAAPSAISSGPCLVLRPDGSLLAVVERQEVDDTWRALRVFN
jgi:tRNA U55 pseudouridine synthase TruB